MAVVAAAMTVQAAPAGAAPALHRIESATPLTLWWKIQSARAGDVIVLGDGAYGALSLNGKRFAEPGLRIEPAAGAKVTFSSIGIQGSQGIQLRGVEVAIEDNPMGVTVGGSSQIQLEGLKIHRARLGEPNAMMVRNSQYITVTNCDVRDVGTGINFLESDHIAIRKNTFSDIQVDAIRGTSSNLDIEDNTASSFHPTPGDHPDFIQIWGSQTHIAENNIIKNNVYERGTGDVAQGIFIEDNKNITITGNAIAGPMYNGISLSRVSSALIENNFVQGYADMGSRIIVRGGSRDVVIRGNTAEAVINYEADGPNPGFKAERNTIVRGAKVGDTAAMKAWLKARRPE